MSGSWVNAGEETNTVNYICRRWGLTGGNSGRVSRLQEIVERFGRYVERKGLRINVKKTKVMTFRKGAGMWREMEIKWRDESVEEIKEFFYLGYVIS